MVACTLELSKVHDRVPYYKLLEVGAPVYAVTLLSV